MITVKELIEQLSKFDENLVVCVHCFEDTNPLEQVRIETKKKHCYDQGDHVLEFMDFKECVMLSDEGYHKLDEKGYMAGSSFEDDEEDYEEEE